MTKSDATLITLDLAGIAYSAVVIVMGLTSDTTYAVVGVIIGAIGLAMFLPGLVVLVLGLRRSRHDGGGDTLIQVGRITIAVPVALAAYVVLQNLLVFGR